MCISGILFAMCIISVCRIPYSFHNRYVFYAKKWCCQCQCDLLQGRKTSVNRFLYVSTSGSPLGSDRKSGTASQCLSIVELPDWQGQYRTLRRSSVTYECKRCWITVLMSDDKPLTRSRLSTLAGQIWTNQSSTSLGVTGVSVLHGPHFTKHNIAKLFTTAQSRQGAVERLPMH